MRQNALRRFRARRSQMAAARAAGSVIALSVTAASNMKEASLTITLAFLELI
jgi:hypothetical protein